MQGGNGAIMRSSKAARGPQYLSRYLRVATIALTEAKCAGDCLRPGLGHAWAEHWSSMLQTRRLRASFASVRMQQTGEMNPRLTVTDVNMKKFVACFFCAAISLVGSAFVGASPAPVAERPQPALHGGAAVAQAQQSQVEPRWPAVPGSPPPRQQGQPAQQPSGATSSAAQNEKPPRPTRIEIVNSDNWVVTCNEFGELQGKRRVCSASLQVSQQETNQVVFSWTVAADDSGRWTTVLQTPTGVAIVPGVELRIGKGAPHKVPFASCETGRCVASVAMDNGFLQEMTAATTAEVIIRGAAGNAVQFAIQMKGFDRAYQLLSKN